MTNIARRLTELDVLLDYIDEEEWLKIPDDIIFYIEKNKSRKYKWEYDESKTFEEQKVHKDTFAMLTYLMVRYVADEEEKEEIKKIFDLAKNNKKQVNTIDCKTRIEFEKSNDLKQALEINVVEKNESKALVDTNKETNFIGKIKEFFKKLFKK